MRRTPMNSCSNLSKTLLYATTLSVKGSEARRLRSLPKTCMLTCTRLGVDVQPWPLQLTIIFVVQMVYLQVWGDKFCSVCA